MKLLFTTNKISSEESSLFKKPAKGKNTPKNKLINSNSSSPLLSDNQSTIFSTSTTIDDPSDIECMKFLGAILLSDLQAIPITDINFKDIKLGDENKGNEKEKKEEDFGKDSEINYLRKKRKVRFKSIKKIEKVTLFKTYQFNSTQNSCDGINEQLPIQKKFKIDKLKKRINGKNEGNWSYDEHIRFIHGVVTFRKNWSNIAKYVGTRTPRQIRSHSQKFYKKLKQIKNNEFNINFQNKNIKNIFDIIYFIKERSKPKQNENDYAINALISLTKNLNYNFLLELSPNYKVKRNYKKKVLKKIVLNQKIKTFEDPKKKMDDINLINDKDINNKLNDDNTEEKEEKIDVGNNNNINPNKKEIEDEKEDDLQNEYINTPKEEKFFFYDGPLYSSDELNFTDINDLMLQNEQNFPYLKFLSNYCS